MTLPGEQNTAGARLSAVFCNACAHPLSISPISTQMPFLFWSLEVNRTFERHAVPQAPSSGALPCLGLSSL